MGKKPLRQWNFSPISATFILLHISCPIGTNGLEETANLANNHAYQIYSTPFVNTLPLPPPQDA